MSVVNKLTGSKNRRNEFGFVNQVVQTGFQNADQVFSRVTASSDGFDIIFVELFFVNVAVIGFQLLFGIQLFAVVGHFLSSLAVLTRSIFSLVQRAFRIAPQIGAVTAVCFFLGVFNTFHKKIPFNQVYCIIVSVVEQHKLPTGFTDPPSRK